jgi:hypothetical protein
MWLPDVTGACFAVILVVSLGYTIVRQLSRPRYATVVIRCHQCFDRYHDVPAWEAEGFVCGKCRSAGAESGRVPSA